MKIAKRATILIFISSLVIWGYGRSLVKKQDVTPPVISSESTEFHIDAANGSSGLLEGLTAKDDVDGDLTANIIVGSISPFKEKGISDVEYIVFDSSDNVGRYERTVHFDNYESPTFQLSKALVYELNGEINISDRITATDMLEGDISDKIRFSSPNFMKDEEGTYILRAEVKNSYGDAVKLELPINVVRYSCDRECIQLNEYLVYMKQGERLSPWTYIEKITDRLGEPVSGEQVRITRDVDYNRPGTGQICYELYENDKVVYATYLTVIVTE